MASIDKKESLSVSLFPMFNILVCTLGVLIFIMTTVSVLSLGKGKTLTIVTDTISKLKFTNATKVPHYLVWDGASIVMPEKKDTVVVDTTLSQFQTYQELNDYLLRKIHGTETGKLFDSVKRNSRTQYFVIIVRANGFESFPYLKYFIKTEGIDIGYEPVNNDSPIKL